MCLLGRLVTCAKFELLFISTFQIKKTCFEKLARRNHTEYLREIYLLTLRPTKQPTKQQNPEVEKQSRTMQNLSRLRELINRDDTRHGIQSLQGRPTLDYALNCTDKVCCKHYRCLQCHTVNIFFNIHPIKEWAMRLFCLHCPYCRLLK